MPKKKGIEGTAVVKSVTHKAGGSVVVLERVKTESAIGQLKDLANAKTDDKELVNFTIEKVQKSLIDDEDDKIKL